MTDTAQFDMVLAILATQDAIADIVEPDDPAAAEVIRQSARLFCELGDVRMDDVHALLRERASPSARAAIDRAESCCQAIADKLRQRDQEQP